MNKSRRKLIDKLVESIELIKQKVEAIIAEENEFISGLHDSVRQPFEDGVAHLNDVIEKIEDIVLSFEDAKGE